jgi:hypothetical protein
VRKKEEGKEEGNSRPSLMTKDRMEKGENWSSRLAVDFHSNHIGMNACNVILCARVVISSIEHVKNTWRCILGDGNGGLQSQCSRVQ